MTNSVRKEGDKVIITMDASEAHGLRVALEECPCKSTKSTATKEVRQRLKDALARVRR